MCVDLRAKFEFSSMILTSFRLEGGGIILLPPLLTSERTPKKRTQIKIK